MPNETHRTPLRYKISEFFSNLLGRKPEVTKVDRVSIAHDTVSFSKQAGAIRDASPGHFETVQCFSQQLDLSILGDQAAKEELMNGSSRFARYRGKLVFTKG